MPRLLSPRSRLLFTFIPISACSYLDTPQCDLPSNLIRTVFSCRTSCVHVLYIFFSYQPAVTYLLNTSFLCPGPCWLVGGNPRDPCQNRNVRRFDFVNIMFFNLKFFGINRHPTSLLSLFRHSDLAVKSWSLNISYAYGR